MIDHGDILGREIGDTCGDEVHNCFHLPLRHHPASVGRHRYGSLWRRPFPDKGTLLRHGNVHSRISDAADFGNGAPKFSLNCGVVAHLFHKLALGHGRLFRQGIEAPSTEPRGKPCPARKSRASW